MIQSLTRQAISATLHCLTGCAIGEILGMVLTTALGWGNATNIVVSIVLAFFFGYSLAIRPVLAAGVPFRSALGVALAADTVSITVMELVDNATIVIIPGAINAGLTDVLFWASLVASLVIAFVITVPVNRFMIARGRGHAGASVPSPLMDAVRENAEWCDLYVRAQGVSTSFGPDLWWAHSRTPEFYPDAVTLSPDVPPATVLERIDTSSGASVKDSFATLDLSPYGFEILFEAQWIFRPRLVDPISDWASEECDLPGVAVRRSSDRTARVTAHRSGDVVGLSNLVLGSHDWPDAVAAVSAAFPGHPIVGYERPDDLPAALAAGFITTGPLRVWFKP